MTTNNPKVIAILGAGPGLGMSMAHRFGREGFAVALVSRSTARHSDYQTSLTAAGVTSRAYVADITDESAIQSVIGQITNDLGTIDTIYFGPAANVSTDAVVPIEKASTHDVRAALESALLPAVATTSAVLPRMLERGTGALFYAGGLSGKYPMPMLGNIAPTAAALRMYVLTLNAALADSGVYAGTLMIGGLIERGDIYRAITDNAERTGTPAPSTLNPDEIAETAWQLYVSRDRAEAEFRSADFRSADFS